MNTLTIYEPKISLRRETHTIFSKYESMACILLKKNNSTSVTNR